MTDPTPPVDPIRKGLLPATPPPEWKFSSAFATGPDAKPGLLLVPGDSGPVVVRRQVTYGDWEPVRPDRWAEEPPSEVRAVSVPASAPTDEPERRNRYDAAIREAEGWVLDDGHHMLDAVIAVADAEQAGLRTAFNNQVNLFAAEHDRHAEETRRLHAAAEEERLALSQALGLGTGAPWDAIRDRAAELHQVQQPVAVAETDALHGWYAAMDEDEHSCAEAGCSGKPGPVTRQAEPPAVSVPASAPTDQAAFRARLDTAIDDVFTRWQAGLGDQRPQDAIRDAVLAALSVPADLAAPLSTFVLWLDASDGSVPTHDGIVWPDDATTVHHRHFGWTATHSSPEIARQLTHGKQGRIAWAGPGDRAAIRAAALREAADYVGNDDDCTCGGCDTCLPRKMAAELRRRAAAVSGPPDTTGQADIGTEFVQQADHPDTAALNAFGAEVRTLAQLAEGDPEYRALPRSRFTTRPGTATVASDMCPRCKGESSEAWELCANCAESRIVAHVPAARNELHCLRCAPLPLGDIWTPVTAEELENGGICTECGTDVLLAAQAAP